MGKASSATGSSPEEPDRVHNLFFPLPLVFGQVNTEIRGRLLSVVLIGCQLQRSQDDKDTAWDCILYPSSNFLCTLSPTGIKSS